jgi:methionyl-tRNA formyltransferase
VRTVFLGTSDFAATVLARLAESPHKPALAITRPDAPRGRGRKLAPPPLAVRARELGVELLQPERLHEDDVLERIAAVGPDALIVCAYGALIRDPLLSDYEVLNVHPSLLPRWRGAAPIERAIMAGDERTGVSIIRLVAELDAGPICLQDAVAIEPDDDFGTLAAKLERLSGELLVRALDEQPEFVEQDADGVTYAHKIEARDRALDFTLPPDAVERQVRALRPHIGARLPLPGGDFLGVLAARVDGETLAPAGGRVRVEGDRVLLDCNGGALELTEVRPPGGRPMPPADWLRGRTDEERMGYFLDPALPERSIDELVRLATVEWDSDAEWAPNLSALAHRGDEEVLFRARAMAVDSDPRVRGVAAYVLGQLGTPSRTFPAESAAALEAMAAGEPDAEVLAAVAHGFGHLGEEYGLETLLRLSSHPEARVREGAATALAGRRDEQALAALIALSDDDEAEVRDWATFALGILAPQDTPELRDALVARLRDPDPQTRLEAVHGLAVRGDERAVEPALELLAAASAAGGDGDGDGIWRRMELRETAKRLAAITRDPRFEPYLPADC